MSHSSFSFLTLVAAALALALPAGAHAQSRPACLMAAVTSQGVAMIEDEGKEVLVVKGSYLGLAWVSENATRAEDASGRTATLSGVTLVVPMRTTDYAYRFAGDGREAECSMTAVVASASFDAGVLSTTSSKPTLAGEAEGVDEIQVVVRESGTNGSVIWRSEDLKIRGGEWSAKLGKSLDAGTYTVELYAADTELNKLGSGALTVRARSSESDNGNATVSVSSVPLLFGDTASAGSSVPVAYVKISNPNSTDVSLRGITLRQNGSAPGSVVAGFTTSDDKGGSRTSVDARMGSEGTFVPLEATIPAGQFRIYTIKAVLGTSIGASLGRTLMIDVESVDTSARESGAFPLRGVTWTLI